jgi:signal transduction histidine kinase
MKTVPEQSVSAGQQADELVRRSNGSSPQVESRASQPARWVLQHVASDFGRRHVKGVAVTRYLVAIWLVCLGVVFCVLGYWWGALLFLVAALNAWLAYYLPRWRVAFDPEGNLRRVRELERSRALVVDDAAARLRRIEQDLHDGAQAQMVAVVMKLGLAREHLGSAIAGTGPSGPDRALEQRALELIDAAHRGAMEAISDLRDLARGIHPPALDEGLAPALAVLAERSELPVDLTVDLPERPSAAIETIAYFCAAELLTNVAKHGSAEHVTLEAGQRPGMVWVRVSDDGSGGAHVEPGGGLAGLADRVRTVDGRLQVVSPPGGPTVVTVELPSHA